METVMNDSIGNLVDLGDLKEFLTDNFIARHFQVSVMIDSIMQTPFYINDYIDILTVCRYIRERIGIAKINISVMEI